MSNEITQITPFDGYGADASDGGGAALARMNPGATGGGDGAAQEAVLKRIHQSLRGRYWIAIVLGLICGGAGGYFGFRSQTPVYRGEGLLQIAFQTRGVTGSNDVTGPMINFEEYIASQAMMISSRRIIDMATKRPEWRLTGLPDTLEQQTQVAKDLTVEHPTRTELIRIYYPHKNAEVAGNVVRAIVSAYVDFSATRSTIEDAKRMKVLDDRKALLAGQVARLDTQILEAANRFGSANLDALLEAKLEEETKIENRMHEAELALEAAKRKKDAKQAVLDLSENQISMIDPVMRGLLMEREQIMGQLAQMRARGVGEEHTQMKQLKAVIEMQQKKLEKYAAEWRDLQMRFSEEPSLAGNGIPKLLQLSPKVLEGECDALRRKYEQIKNDRTDIGRHMLKIQDLQRQREELSKDRADVQRRMDMLQMEASMSGRLSVVNPGEVPVTPFKDRRKIMGAAGALGGFGFPVMLLVFLGLFDKRFRYSDEAIAGVENVPLLGILPRLPDKLSDPEQAAVAAHCIHQIRIMLQVGNNPERRRVFMITSASCGDGKTSLTMALGLSFAASGSKTLVIDCDMVGQGLTHRLRAHGMPGLLETLNLGTLRGHVRKTASKGLYVLPIGNADAVHAGVLSRQGIGRLLAACREHFDVVVIDTGPILGSLEASVVAAEADGVIMAVARGQQQPMVDKAIRHLRAIGATVFGIVFNRAEHRDFHRSVASASIRSLSARQSEPRGLLPESEESSRFGPLARSVASCLPPSDPRSNGES